MKERFFNLQKQPQHLTDNHLYDPLKEALACDAISTKVGETTPAEPHLYGASRMSGVEPISRKSTCKVGRGQLIIQTIPRTGKYVEGK